MGRLWKLAVAMTALTAMLFSSAAGATLWHLWRHPPRLALEQTPEGLKWEGGGYAALIKVRDQRMDWLMIWATAPPAADWSLSESEK